MHLPIIKGDSQYLVNRLLILFLKEFISMHTLWSHYHDRISNSPEFQHFGETCGFRCLRKLRQTGRSKFRCKKERIGGLLRRVCY